MDVAHEELQFLSITDIVRESFAIPRLCTKTFYLITLTLIFPLSFAILAQSSISLPIVTQILYPFAHTSNFLTKLLTFLFFYMFLFALSLLSTAAVVFTVASLYASKPVSFSSTVSAIPKAFKRLLITFVWVMALTVLYNVVCISVLFLLLIAVNKLIRFLLFPSLIAMFMLSLFGHVYITALWQLASVVSVLEPVYGLAAMKKSYALIKGKSGIAFVLVFVYLMVCGAFSGVFGGLVVHGVYGVLMRIVLGGFLVGVLVIVNLVGLLVQSVFYYVCKSYHNQAIDKSALYDHLGGYLGEYVPLKSSVQMEDLP